MKRRKKPIGQMAPADLATFLSSALLGSFGFDGLHLKKGLEFRQTAERLPNKMNPTLSVLLSGASRNVTQCRMCCHGNSASASESISQLGLRQNQGNEKLS